MPTQFEFDTYDKVLKNFTFVTDKIVIFSK